VPEALRLVVLEALRFAGPGAPRLLRRVLAAPPPAPARAAAPVRPVAPRRRSGAGVFLGTP